MTVAIPEIPTTEQRNQYPFGALGIPAADDARSHLFTNSLLALDVPDGTIPMIRSSASVVDNMNEICREMLATDAAWLWVIGDDHTFPRDTVLRLLAHDVDIVVPLCARRCPPFSLVAFDEIGEKDEHGRHLFHILQYDDIPDDTPLMEIAAAGTAGMLIRRRVLEDLGYPWFSSSDGYSINEDVEFCRRAGELGYKVWLDTTFAIGHIGKMVVVPGKRGGHRGFSLNFPGGGGNNELFIPHGIRADDSGAPDVRAGTLGWE